MEIKASKTESPTPQLVMIGFDFFCDQQKVAIDEKRKTSLYNKLINLVGSEYIIYKELE